MSFPIQPFGSMHGLDGRLATTSQPWGFERNQETAQRVPYGEVPAIKGRPKRKLTEDCIPQGTSVADTYLKRSRTLIKKAQELAESTNAFVVTFTARPESIGEGRYRIFISNNLESADPDLTKRITAATEEIKAIAIEIAHRSRQPIRRTKRTYVDVNERPTTSERAPDSPSTARAEGQSSTQASSHDNSKQESCQVLAHASFVPRGCSPPAATNDASVKPAQTRNVSHALNIGDEIQVMLEKNEINYFVGLFNTDSKEIQLHALAEIKRLISLDSSAWIRRCTMIIPSLVKLLESDNPRDEDITRECILLLSQMSTHWHLSNVMAQAGAFSALDRLLPGTESTDVLELMVQTMTQCQSEGRLQANNLIRPFLILLSSGKASHWFTATEALKRYSFLGTEHREVISGGVCQLLCFPPSGISNLLALDTASSIISKFHYFFFLDQDISQIDQYLLQPLLNLVHDPSSSVRLSAIRSLYHLSHHPSIEKRFDMPVVIPPILALLSTNDDHLFMETASVLWWWKGRHSKCESGVDIPEHICISAAWRLVSLLSCTNTQIAVVAAKHLAEMVWDNDDGWSEENALSEIITGRERQSIIRLLASEHWDVRHKAGKLLHSLHQAFQFELRQDDVPLLLRAVILESSADAATTDIPFHIWQALEYDSDSAVAFVEAGAIPHFVGMLSREKPVDDWWFDVLRCVRLLAESSDEASTAFLNAGVIQALLELTLRLWNNRAKKDVCFYRNFYDFIQSVFRLLSYFLEVLDTTS